MKKKIIISISLIAAVFILGIAAGVIILQFDGISVSTGTALISENGTCFLIKGNSPVRLSDYSENGDKLNDIESGDRLFVIHDGINESYPASTGVYFCKKTGSGSIEDIPEEVISSLSQLGWLVEAPGADDTVSIDFNEKHIRTGTPQYDTGADIDFPVLTVIKTDQELKKYSEDNSEKYALGDSFYDAAKDYDEEFFRENALLLCFVQEGSGSNTHEIREILMKEEKHTDIFLNTISPEAGTCDMAYHHIFISVKKSDIKDTEIRLFFNEENSVSEGRNVIIGKDYANFSLTLPENWSYEEINDVNNDFFGISLFNDAAPESTLTIEFDSLFGVCGTGLRTEKVEINGYKAHMGIYDANPTFDYIVFEDTPGYYVIKNNADVSWWKSYGDVVREILGTLKIADGIIFREEAVLIASEKAEGEYKRKVTEYDYKEGIWTIAFAENETEHTVRIDASGNIL